KPAALMRPIARLQSLLRRAGLVVVKADHPAVRYLDALPISPLSFALHRAFPHLWRRTFLQVGANDGQRNDPIVDFIARFDWKGTLIEPRSTFVRCLSERYAENAEIRVVQAAIAESAGAMCLYSI